MHSSYATFSLGLALFALASLGGCKRGDYPACSKDKHCQADETCVDSLCQNCSADADCGDGQRCAQFRCEEARGTSCDACDPGLICVSNSCQSCTQDEQCDSGVCSGSGRCEPLPCATDDDCPIDEICDGGQCIYNPLESDEANAVCGVSILYFGFDSAKLSPNNQEQLTQAAACLVELLQGGGELILEAHADNVGGEEYNILLTDRRGGSVRDFLTTQGVSDEQMRVVGKGAMQARGTDESSRAKDRRVVFIVSQ